MVAANSYQVRTPEFIRWFGDWLRASHKRFLDGEPVATMRGGEVPQFSKVRALFD